MDDIDELVPEHSEVAADVNRDTSSALARRTGQPGAYAVLVVANDVGDAVNAAGGWMVDRLRAGWRVCAMAPEGSDLAPLRILGATARTFDATGKTPALMPLAASLAVSAELLIPAHPMSGQMRAVMQDYAMEVTVWGVGDLDALRRFEDTRYRPSPAAQAFKTHALRAAARMPTTARIEPFRSSSPWYPLDRGADLERVGRKHAAR